MRPVVVLLHPGATPCSDALERVRTEPGLGAVVDVGQWVVVHQRLLSWAPREQHPDDAAWLRALRLRLEAKGYRVEDAGGALLPSAAVAPSRHPRAVLRRVVRTPLRQRVRSARRRLRRQAFLARLRWEAWLVGADLVVQVAEDFVVGPGVRFELRPGPVRVEIGPRCRMASGVVLRLGGELVIGPNCELRHDLVLNVKGRLHLEGRNVLGVGVMVHADLPLLFEWGASVAEYATVLDTDHEFDGSLVHMFDQQVLPRPVRLGACSFLGAKSSVMPGVTVGRRAVVGAGSVVTKDVPEGTVVTGVPARVARTLPEPGG